MIGNLICQIGNLIGSRKCLVQYIHRWLATKLHRFYYELNHFVLHEVFLAMLMLIDFSQ